MIRHIINEDTPLPSKDIRFDLTSHSIIQAKLFSGYFQEIFIVEKKQRPYLSTGEVADFLGVQSWRVSRIFELELLEEPARVAGRRAISAELIPIIVDVLRDRGWLSISKM